MNTHTHHFTSSLAAEIAAVWGDLQPTPLVRLDPLAERAGVGVVLAKLEGERPLGSFKSLGGMLAGLRALARSLDLPDLQALLATAGAAAAQRLVCASDGNHGLSVAAAARRVGASATIYLPASVDPVRAERITAMGGQVVLVEGTYDDAVAQAEHVAARGEGLLISDTASDPDSRVVRDVMDGYGLITEELNAQMAGARPTHVFVQAGVGGLAAALASGLRGDGRLIVVEPASAACVGLALREGRPMPVEGGLETAAEMLSCGQASAPALRLLLDHGATGVAVDEAQLALGVRMLRAAGGPAATASGAAGIAGLLKVADDPRLRAEHGLSGDSVVLVVVTEGALTTEAGR